MANPSTLSTAMTAADERAAHAVGTVKSALLNAITLGNELINGRQHLCASDIRLYETMWKTLERHFNATHESSGVAIPHNQTNVPLDPAVKILEAAFSKEGPSA
jgi:hypothetical protein